MVALTAGLPRGTGRTLIGGSVLAAALVAASFPVAAAFTQDFEQPIGLVARLLGSVLAAAGVVIAVRGAATGTRTGLRRWATLVGTAGAALLVWVLYVDRAGVRGAVHSVVIAVLASGTLFVLANRWLDQSLRAWSRFTALTGGAVGLIVGGLLIGNDLFGLFVGTAGSRVDRSIWLLPVVVLAAAAYGFAVGASAGRRRLVVGVVGGAGLGALVGAFLRVGALPTLEPAPLAAATLVLAAVLALVARLRGRDVVRGALLGAGLGWLVGAFGLPQLGAGTAVEGIAGAAGAGVLLGARIGLAPTRDVSGRLRLEGRVRTVIFLAPAITFISAALIIPTIRTIYLSLLDRSGETFVGLENFRFIFDQPSFYDPSAWRSAFSSTEFLLSAVALVIGTLLALRQRRRIDGVLPPRLLGSAVVGAALLVGTLADRAQVFGEGANVWHVLAPALIAMGVGLLVWYGRRHEGNTGLSGPGGGLVAAAGLLLAFALFTTLRGTVINNLWWVVFVTSSSAGLGLAIAALADRTRRGESVAKSIIFMPMAISFVGAGIIWRFMYLARPEGRSQTGVLNALYVGLGNASVSPSAPRTAVVLFVIAALLVVFGALALRGGALGTGWFSVLMALFLTWVALRFLDGGGFGGVRIVDGVRVEQPLLFISDLQRLGAYNNVFLMVPFIWIYTGFAMVIFSAAIKGVPADLLEAGRVDGATESQSFWRIVLPQIRPTIGVVLTTIIVVVMKVFDIVKVMTNGNFGTQVLANEMWNRAFQDGNFPVGSAVAAVLFLSVLPVMYVNIRRMQKDAA